MEYAHLALHLLPTLVVVVLAFVIARAVSVRVTWRQSTVRHVEDATARSPMRGAARRLEVTAPREAPGPRERPAAPPLRPHAA